MKDDFFDTLSCDALTKGGQIGRTKFSEQRKIDTEVSLCWILNVMFDDCFS